MCLKHLMVLQSIFIDAVSYETLTVTLRGRGYDARLTGREWKW